MRFPLPEDSADAGFPHRVRQIGEFGSADLQTMIQVAERLPTCARRIFTLRKVYRYSQQQIAETLQVSDREVHEGLVAAARASAECLAQADIVPSEALAEDWQCH